MRWFVFSSDTPPVVRTKKIRTTAKLTLESLEERRCLAADVEFAASNCTQLSVAENELSQFESAAAATSGPQEHALLQGESCTDKLVERGNSGGADGIKDIETDDLVSDYPEGSSLEGHEHTAVMLGSQFLNTGSANVKDDGNVPPILSFSPSDPRTERISSEWTHAVQADTASAPQQVGASGFDSLAPKEALLSPAPNFEPSRLLSDARPLIQPVEVLRVLPDSPLNVGQMNEQFTSLQFSFETRDVRIGIHQAGSDVGKLKVPFMAETSKTAANPPISKTKYESVRPSISAVIALMPSLKPLETKQINDVAVQEDVLSARLISAVAAKVGAEFMPKEEEVTAAATGAVFPEMLGEPQEEKRAESINPLCFVVLVGLIGIPKPDRFRLIRKNGTRDNSPTPGPISVVPLVNELEPWPKTTFVKRTQDETI